MSKTPASKTELGAAAETRAAEYLQSHGLIVLARNLRCKAGELDLVCLDREVLVIVEVRQRTRTDFGGAPASVTAHKQRKLIRATQFFWQRHPDWHARILRFDVVALQTAPPGRTSPTAPAPGVNVAQRVDVAMGVDIAEIDAAPGLNVTPRLDVAPCFDVAPDIEWIKDAFRAGH